MRLIFTILSILLFSFLKAQTVIEMTHPGDANLVLLEVDKPEDADIIVYKTDKKEEYEEWNCKWKFKKWGFSNFSVYLTKNPNDSLLNDEEMGVQYSIQGRIYFTNNKEEAGYKTPGFQLEGVLRRTTTNTSKEATESKKKVLEKEKDEE
ncbi:MAG: hypothetical protein N2449_06380 [Bacteroidales bacterium]|nr:hypothetical protein [Bacteroidales bacterium]